MGRLFLVIADRAEKRLVRSHIEFGLLAEKRRQARLRIKIDRQGPVAVKSQVLGKMGGGRGLAAAAFEIHHRDDLKLLACPAVRQIPAVSPGPLVELLADLGNVGNGIRAASPLAVPGWT